MNIQGMERWNAFLRRYESQFPHRLQDKVDAFKQEFGRLKIAYEAHRAEVDHRVMTLAPAFSIFLILGAHRLELSHSAFLAHLLDPGGSHGQRDLFLRAFLSYCAGKYVHFPLPRDTVDGSTKWNCQTECVIPGGRLDVLLENPVLGCRYVIENKVGAAEQDGQLAFYARWMEKHQEEYAQQALVFLTQTGYAARTAGTYSYFCLSYHEDVVGWLKSATPHIKAPNVREIVRQYTEVAAYV